MRASLLRTTISSKVGVACFTTLLVFIIFGFNSSSKDKSNPLIGKWLVVGYMHRGPFILLSVETDKVIYDFETDSTGKVSRNDSTISAFSWSRHRKFVTINDLSGKHEYRFVLEENSLELQDQGSGLDEHGKPYTPKTWGIKFLKY